MNVGVHRLCMYLLKVTYVLLKIDRSINNKYTRHTQKAL